MGNIHYFVVLVVILVLFFQ